MLKPSTYHAAARKLRRIADQLDARAEPRTPRQKAALTSAVYGLSRYARALADRHRRAVDGKPYINLYPILDDIEQFILRDGRGHCVTDAAAKDLAKQISRKLGRQKATTRRLKPTRPAKPRGNRNPAILKRCTL